MYNGGEVIAHIGADISEYISAMKQIGKDTTANLGGAQKVASTVGKTMIGVGAATTVMGVKSLKGFGEFNQSLNSAAVIAGGTSKDIDGLADVANRMGAELPLSAQDSADAMVAMARDGASISDIKKEFPSIAQAATAAGSDLQQTAGVVQNAMNIWGKSIGSPQQAAATLVTTANLSNASVEDMQHALATIGATANLAGMSMQDTSSAIGLLTNQGFSAADASQDLNHAILQMMAPSDKASGLMEDLGLSFKDSHGNMKPFKQIALEVAKATDGMGKADKAAALKTIFHSAGMKAMVPIMKAVEDKTGDTKTSWDAFTGAVNKSTSSQKVATKVLADQAQEMQKNVGAKIEQVGGNWESLSNKAMATKSGVSSTLLDWTNNTLNWAQSSDSGFAKVTRDFIGLAPVIGPATTAVGGFLASAGKITGTVSAAGKGLWNAGKATSEFLGKVSDAGGFVSWIKNTKLFTLANKANTTATVAETTAQKGLNTAVKANPMGIIITAIALVVAALVAWLTQTKSGQAAWKNFTSWLSDTWSGMVTFFQGVWNSITTLFSSAMDGIKSGWHATVTFFSNLWSGIVNVFTTIWSTIQTGWQNFTSIVSGLWQSAVGVFSTVWSAITTFMQPIIDTIVGLWNNFTTTISGIWNGIIKIASGIWGLIKAAVMGPILLLLDAMTGNWNQMKEDAVMIWNSVVDSVKSIVSGLAQVISSYVTGISNFVSTIWNAIASVTSKVWNAVKDAVVGFVSGIWQDIQNIWSAIPGWIDGLWNNVKNGVSNAWNSMWQAIVSFAKGIINDIQNIWNSIPDWISGLWNNVKDAVVGAWNGIWQGAGNFANGVVNDISKAWNGLANWIGGLWNGVKNAIYAAMNINLYDAGRAIMISFWNGFVSLWNKVQKFVGNIAQWIRDHKGPISYDRKLLIPAGRAIMTGFNDALNDTFGDVKKSVSGYADQVSDAFGSVDLSNVQSQLQGVHQMMKDQLSANANVTASTQLAGANGVTFGAELDDDVLNAPSAVVEIEVHQEWDGNKVRTYLANKDARNEAKVKLINKR